MYNDQDRSSLFIYSLKHKNTDKALNDKALHTVSEEEHPEDESGLSQLGQAYFQALLNIELTKLIDCHYAPPT